MFSTKRFLICESKWWKIIFHYTSEKDFYDFFRNFWKGVQNAKRSKETLSILELSGNVHLLKIFFFLLLLLLLCCENALKRCKNALLLQEYPKHVAKIPWFHGAYSSYCYYYYHLYFYYYYLIFYLFWWNLMHNCGFLIINIS